MASKILIIVVALFAGVGLVAGADTGKADARFPGAEAWGEVRVTAERTPAADFTIAPNGNEIAFFGYNRAYHIYDLALGKVTQQVPTDVSIHDVAYSPDGKVLATAEWFAGINLRDSKTGKIFKNIKPEGNLGVFYATYLQDGKLAAHCWRSDGGAGSPMREQLAVWDPTATERIGWAVTSRVEADGHMIRRRFAGPGRHLLSIETRRKHGYVVDRSATLTDPATNKASRSVPLDMDDDFVFDASPDGRSLLVFNIHRPPRLVDVASGETVHLLRGHRQYVSCGAFSPDGKLVATASGTTRRSNLAPAFAPPREAPTEIIIWDAATGQKIAALEDKTTRLDFAKLAFSPDGKLIVAATTPESPGKGERKGGQMVLWGKLPSAASAAPPADDLRQLKLELDRQKVEIARLRAEVDRLNKLVPTGGGKAPGKLPPAPPPGRFRDRGDHVEDTKTGLLWQKDGDVSGKMNYYDAIKYATGLELGGQAGWRVPTKEELAEIFPAVQAPFTDSKYNESPYGKGGTGEWNSYWTSTVDPRKRDYAYVYHWYAAGGANNCIASQNFAYVRCVHDPAPPKALKPGSRISK